MEKILKIDDVKNSNYFSPLLIMYNNTKTTIGFPVMSCNEWIPFICKNINLKIFTFFDLTLT